MPRPKDGRGYVSGGMIDRFDFERVEEVAPGHSFHYRHAAGLNMLLDGDEKESDQTHASSSNAEPSLGLGANRDITGAGYPGLDSRPISNEPCLRIYIPGCYTSARLNDPGALRTQLPQTILRRPSPIRLFLPPLLWYLHPLESF